MNKPVAVVLFLCFLPGRVSGDELPNELEKAASVVVARMLSSDDVPGRAVSPLSIAEATAHLSEGAKGVTKAELQEVLGLQPDASLRGQFVRLNQSLKEKDLSVAEASLGLRLMMEGSGRCVVSGVQDGIAKRAGIRQGDVIKLVDGSAVSTAALKAFAPEPNDVSIWKVIRADMSEETFVFAGVKWQRVVENREAQFERKSILLVSSRFALTPEFALASNDFGAEVVDSAAFPTTLAAVKEVNRRVASVSGGKIPEAVSLDQITDPFNAVLTNVVWFKGAWRQRFERATKQYKFALAGGKLVDVRAMEVEGDFNYLDGGDFEAACVPYQGGDYALWVVCPKGDVKRIVERVGRLGILRVCDGAMRRNVRLVLPKVSIRTEIDLASELSKQGFGSAFSKAADFSAMSKMGGQVDSFRHQCVVNWDEQGTEAVAATTAIVIPKGGAATAEIEFIIDRPFLFFLVSNRLSATVFAGRVNDPRAE